MAEPEDQELRVCVNTRCWLVDGRENRLKKKQQYPQLLFLSVLHLLFPPLSPITSLNNCFY